jgi:Putative cyclase
MDLQAALPSFDQLPVEEGQPAESSWGLWGEHDVFGTLNLLTPERALRAAQSIRTGRSFALNLELTLPDPPLFGRPHFRHEVTGATNRGHDDLLHEWNTQSSSQWDGFRHIGTPELGHYGGVPDEEHGMHHWAARGIVGRAVLADLARWRAGQGRALRQGERDPISGDELLACLADQGTPVEVGDVLLLRTGWLEWYRTLDPAGRAAHAETAASPGLAGLDAVAAVWDLHVSAIAADNPAVEAWPPTPTFLHHHFLPRLGIPLGELWDLDALADDCAADGTYDCFFTSAPLFVPAGVASPPNAIAVR